MELDFSNDTIELLLAKKAISDKKWLNILSNIFDERWFASENIKLMISLIIKFYDKHNSVPNTQVVKALFKKYAENHPDQNIDLTSLNKTLSEALAFDMKLSDDILSFNIKEFIKRNAFKTSLNDSIERMTRQPQKTQDGFDSTSLESVVDNCLKSFDKIQKLTFNDTDLGMNYFDPTAMAAHWEAMKNPDAKIKSGWQSLDEYTNGGFLKDGRMLALIMAQAGLGKSVFLSNLAVNFLKQNLSVVVISLEMSQDVYASRFDAHISNNNINKLGDNAESSIERIKNFYSKYPNSNLYIKEFPPRSISSKDIDAYLENLKAAGHNFDVLIVDYLNLVLPNKRSDSMFKDGMAVSEELRSLSYKYEIPVFSATQANSEGMNNSDIDMQNVSESRGICHTADFLSALFKSDEEIRTDDKTNPESIIWMKILKNRLGGMVGKKSKFVLDPNTLTVADVTNDNGIDITDSQEYSGILNNLKAMDDDLFKMQ